MTRDITPLFKKKTTLHTQLHDLRKVLLLDGDILVKRSLKPLLRLDPLSAGKDSWWFHEFLELKDEYICI